MARLFSEQTASVDCFEVKRAGGFWIDRGHHQYPFDVVDQIGYADFHHSAGDTNFVDEQIRSVLKTREKTGQPKVDRKELLPIYLAVLFLDREQFKSRKSLTRWSWCNCCWQLLDGSFALQ